MKSRIATLAVVLTLAGSARAAFSPIAITPGSYNADVVVEKTATPSLKVVTTASVDQGAANGANTWMEQGFDPANPTYGLLPAGTTFTALSNANYSFQMPPDYTAPNGFLIDSVVSNETITVATPKAYTLLSFLGSGGNGGDVIGVTVHHQDGSTETGQSFGCPDWFNGTINVAFIANERCNSTVNLGYANVGSGNPRLYFRDVILTNSAGVYNTSPVTSIDLYYIAGSSGSHNDIMAVSGATTQGGAVSPIAITGYTYDFIVEASADKRGPTLSQTMSNGTNLLATTESMDSQAYNTGNSWYEQGYNVNNSSGAGGYPIPDPTVVTNTGIPAAGSSVTNPLGDHVYTMPADYTVNDAVFLSPSNTTGTITLATPTAAGVLSFLASGGGGGGTPVVTIHYQDGSTQTGNITVPDWFNTTAPYVYGANGRVAVDTAGFANVDNSARQPRLFNCDIILNNSNSPVTSVDLSDTNTGGTIAIFAVSGATGTVLPAFTTTPQVVNKYAGDNAQFTAVAVANGSITYQWQKGTNGVYVDLANGGNISGVTTTTLSVNNVSLADAADYRCVATDSAGSAPSGSGRLYVFSSLNDVTMPGDPIKSFGGSNFGDSPDPGTIDDNMATKLGMNLSTGGGPSGFVVTTVASGRTIVTGIRIYTANDTVSRDPTDFKLEGSTDGGSTYTLIASNSLALPDGRNSGVTGPPDPLTQYVDEVDFANTNDYSTYRVTFSHYKGGPTYGQMQIMEAELLGVADNSNPAPFFATEPTPVTVYNGGSAYFYAYASGTPSPTYQWQKGTNGVFVDLTDGGSISGSQTASLSVSPASFADAADYVCVATNSAGSANSSTVALTVISTNTDVTQPTDTNIVDIGDITGNTSTLVQAIDDLNSTAYVNGGHGLNAQAGFPPFQGPAGFAITPAVGSTILSGIRIYTSGGATANDPADFTLEGSNDGGTTYNTIASGPLNLPLARPDNNSPFDPTLQPMQEILFNNSSSYTTYRLTFNNTRGGNNNTSNVQIGEAEFLGVPGTNVPVEMPTLSFSSNGSGGFTLSTTSGGELWSTTNLTSGASGWKDEGPISGSTTITPSAGEPTKYYQIRPK